jgi:hypothetical protein
MAVINFTPRYRYITFLVTEAMSMPKVAMPAAAHTTESTRASGVAKPVGTARQENGV